MNCEISTWITGCWNDWLSGSNLPWNPSEKQVFKIRIRKLFQIPVKVLHDVVFKSIYSFFCDITLYFNKMVRQRKPPPKFLLKNHRDSSHHEDKYCDENTRSSSKVLPSLGVVVCLTIAFVFCFKGYFETRVNTHFDSQKVSYRLVSHLLEVSQREETPMPRNLMCGSWIIY